MKKLNSKTYTLEKARDDLLFLNQKIVKNTEKYNVLRDTCTKLSEETRKCADQKIYIKSVISSKMIKRSKALKLRKELMSY